MSVVVVDWLGRGGIAQTAEAWVASARGAGVEATLLAPGGREVVPDVAIDSTRPRLLRHVELVRAAARWIDDVRPDVVVVQNYLVPSLEAIVHRAARRAQARLVFVVHDHRLHSRVAGVGVGLRRLQEAADLVVVHSGYVGANVAGTVKVVPHPAPARLLAEARSPLPARERQAIHFGIVKRAYKGGDVVRLLPATTPGWSFLVAGAGASASPGIVAETGFLPGGRLCALVEQSAAALFPYSFATQSGGIVLAQALGAVPVASAVGGIPEQIVDGATGLLLPRNAPVARWSEALARIGDPAEHLRMKEAGQRAIERASATFTADVAQIVGARRSGPSTGR